MKNLSLALNAVLAVAVIVLYVLHFNGQETEVITAIEDVQTKEDTSTQESIAEAVSVVVGASSSNLPVACILPLAKHSCKEAERYRFLQVIKHRRTPCRTA